MAAEAKPVRVMGVSVAEGALHRLSLGRREVLILRYGGTLRAMDNACNHAGCLLSGGWMDGRTVVCPCHEVGFDVETGKNVTSPGICDDQTVYRVREDAEGFWLEGLPEVG